MIEIERTKDQDSKNVSNLEIKIRILEDELHSEKIKNRSLENEIAAYRNREKDNSQVREESKLDDHQQQRQEEVTWHSGGHFKKESKFGYPNLRSLTRK